jgi:SAM-dependent methyltransferase
MNAAGIRNSAYRFFDYLFDKRYGLDTCGLVPLERLSVTGPNKSRGGMYQGTEVLSLRKLFGSIRRAFVPGDVFVDLGCGKGRTLCVAMEYGFRKVKGVEFARELCKIARENVRKYKAAGKIAVPCEVIETDAAAYKVAPEDTVFYLFNPFDETVFREIMTKIEVSSKQHPRRILLLYNNPVHGNYFDQEGGFKPVWGIHCGPRYVVGFSN